MSNIAIKAENISKKYLLRQPIKDSEGRDVHELLALDNISFEIKKGESVGIVGPNGSGKSTLLKILSGVTKPTSGEINVEGKIGSILDIGAGFHPELSGRENVFLNGQIHGFSKKAIRAKFDDIVEFSGIGNFIDEPVKNYSNGMYLRLAFSIMAHLEFDIYLFDEVFSVGDAAFNLRTRNKFEELLTSGSTVLYVSHNINELLRQEDFMVLEEGRLKKRTKKKSVLADYLEDILVSDGVNVNKQFVSIDDFSSFPASEDVKVLKVHCYQESSTDDLFRTDKALVLKIEYQKMKSEDTVDVLINILDSTGNVILTSTPFVAGNTSKSTEKGKYACTCVIPPMFFNSQVYYISVLFFKNLGTIVKRQVSEQSNFDQLEGGKVEVVCKLNQLIAFKPVLTIPDFNVDPNTIVNMQAPLLAGFEWTTESE